MPMIKTPIGAIDPSTIEGLKSRVDPNYGNTLIERDCEKILVIRAPVSDPDPVNDLEKGVAQLDNFDIKPDRIILMGYENSISIDGTTAEIVLSRMKKNPNRDKYKIKKETAAPQAQAAQVTDAMRELDAQGAQLPSFMVRRARTEPQRQEKAAAPGLVEREPKAGLLSVAPKMQPPSAHYGEFEEKFEEALRGKGFMIFDVSGQHGGETMGVIASRKAGYPRKMLLHFCKYCSQIEVESVSQMAEALDADFCLMIYEDVDKAALQSSLGRKVELISRGFSSEFLDII